MSKDFDIIIGHQHCKCFVREATVFLLALLFLFFVVELHYAVFGDERILEPLIQD